MHHLSDIHSNGRRYPDSEGYLNQSPQYLTLSGTGVEPGRFFATTPSTLVSWELAAKLSGSQR